MAPRRLLITAGPTHEPIDAVRYLGNRSSGRLGIALAEAAAAADWHVTLLLGPTPLSPGDTHIRLRRFLTTADLQALLREEAPNCDVLVMAAAVADYRPKLIGGNEIGGGGKIRRSDGPLTLELEPTPDLLASLARDRRPDQLFVGFALEPRERLMESARDKLARKRLDMIVANPLETMDSPLIEATVLCEGGVVHQSQAQVSKERFAEALLDLIAHHQRAAAGKVGAA